MKRDNQKLPALRMNWLDKVVYYVSPAAGLGRMRSKLMTNVLRKYEGASKSRRTGGWKAPGTSANSEIQGSLETLRNRARQLVRDNAYAHRGLQVINSNVVGRGIHSQVKVVSGQQRQSNALANRRAAELQAVWKAWSDTPAIDYEGRMTLKQMQKVVMDAVTESGEVLIRLRRVGRQIVETPAGPIEVPPIQLQILESDFLDTNQIASFPANGNTVIQGVEFDDRGRRVAYHMYEEHPGNLSQGIGFNLKTAFKTVRIPASEVIHAYRSDRPGQVRGVSWLHPVMIRLKDFDEYEDAQLVKQKISTMWAAFIRDLEGDPAGQTEHELIEQVEPGLVEILPQGKDIIFSNPPTTEGYKEYTSTVLHAIAAGLGITFESLTGDLSEVNFSSARMGWLEMSRNVDAWRSDIMIHQVLDPVWDWFRMSLPLIDVDPLRATMKWSAPRREMIDPTKEVPALKEAVRSGFTSLSEAIRAQGLDPETHFEEMMSDQERLDELGLVLDTDPRQDPRRLSAAPPTNGVDSAE